MKYKILLPVTVLPEYVRKMADTLAGHEANLIVVNNWTHPEVHQLSQEFCNRGAEVYDCRFNLGLAASWNLGFRRMEETDSDFVIILSPSVIFRKPIQCFIDEVISQEKQTPQFYSDYRNDYNKVNLHCFVRTRLAITLMGYYDENFWPIYTEDTDYCKRSVIYNNENTQKFISKPLGLDFIDTEGWSHSCTTSKELLYLYQSNSHRHSVYYQKKWGGDLGQGTYQRPFNNPSTPLHYWEVDDSLPFKKAYSELKKYTPSGAV